MKRVTPRSVQFSRVKGSGRGTINSMVTEAFCRDFVQVRA